jgi:hypothetical protein
MICCATFLAFSLSISPADAIVIISSDDFYAAIDAAASLPRRELRYAQ